MSRLPASSRLSSRVQGIGCGEDALVRVELDELQSAVGGDVLVLLADRLAADLDLDAAGLRRQPLGAHEPAGEGVERVEQADRVAARGAEPRALRGHVGDRGDLDAALDPDEAERLADQLVTQLGGAVHHLGDRVARPDAVVELAVDRDVDVLVDRGAEHGAALAPVERAQVGAPAGKADAQRRPGDDHGA